MAYDSLKNNTESIMSIARELKNLDAYAEGYANQIGIMAGLVLIACRIDDLEAQIAKMGWHDV